MGCPSIGIYSYELIHFYGVKNLIRVGTAGALRPEVKVRDMVFGMGACTTSNYVKQFRLPCGKYFKLRHVLQSGPSAGGHRLGPDGCSGSGDGGCGTLQQCSLCRCECALHFDSFRFFTDRRSNNGRREADHVYEYDGSGFGAGGIKEDHNVVRHACGHVLPFCVLRYTKEKRLTE